MSNDKTTLADVQPGGRVRLGDGPTIENRARELLDTELRKLGMHEDAYHVGCGADLDRNDQAAINAIAAALAARQPVDVFAAYETWPDDLKAKLSAHDLRRMNGWAPRTSARDWRIDTSAGDPILVYKGCSVIEGEDARYVLSLIEKDTCQPEQEPVAEYQYRFWNDDMPGWSSWQPISKSDYERELVEPFEGREVRALYASPSSSVDLKRARDSIQALLNWIDDWAETPEESGLDPIADRALEVVAQIDAQVYAHAPNTNPAQPSPAGQGGALADAARRVLSDVDSGDYHGEISEATYAALEAALAARQPVGEQHPDDLAVDAFAAAMKAKMAEARAKGRGGWEDPAQCTAEDLSRMLRSHVEKGDPRDVANFCMMLHQRGEAIVARQPVGEQRAALWIQFAKNGNIQFWTKDQDRALAESFLHARPLTAFYASPQQPAQAVDLGQFRQPVQDWLDDAQASMEEHGDYDGVFGYAIEEGTRLLALIDSQAVGNG